MKTEKSFLTPMRRKIWISLLLAGTTFAVYAQVCRYGFVQYDDREYVTENRQVKAGWTIAGVEWAFSGAHAGNWHPLTWLSHMTDCQLFGLNAGAHHCTSLLLHIVNTLLLFSVLLKMTGALWRSAFVATVFALHPLHVESVAWIAERKDVLSTLFGFLTLLGYVRYVEKPATSRYLISFFCFALALMAKPMMVTIPFVLLLLDFWPLRRATFDPTAAIQPNKRKKQRSADVRLRSAGYLIREKLPFFALAAASSVITILAQNAGGAVVSTQKLPVVTRLANALLSYVRYLGKIIWPEWLAVFYPYPRVFSTWEVGAAVFLLVGISVAVVLLARRLPYLVVGWFWFIGTLVPVIGIVQVGLQSMADRYTYVPMIGILIIVAWGAPELVSGWRWGRTATLIVVPLLLVVFSVQTWNQVQSWRDTVTLFGHAQETVGNNFLALNGMGSVLADRGDYSGALPYYEEATKINPAYAQARSNLGIALFKLGKVEEAMKCYREALRLSPDYSEAHYNLGVALFSLGRLEEAISSYRDALQANPDNANASYNLAIALATAGRTREAVEQYQETLRINPDSAEANNNLGILLFNGGRFSEAAAHFSEAVRLKPDWAEARRNLDIALAQKTRQPR